MQIPVQNGIGTTKKRGRLISIDHLKFLSIILMVMVHVMEECSATDPSEVLPANTFQYILNFLLMMCTFCFLISIGLGFGFSKNKTWEAIAKRGWHLLVLAYVLNFLRAALPYAIRCIIDGEFDFTIFLYYLLSVDILHFAGISYLLLSLMTRFKVSRFLMIAIALLMQAIGTVLDTIELNSPVLTILLSYFIASDISFFPVFQFFIYIVAGICLDDLFRRSADHDLLCRRMLVFSLVGLLALIVESNFRELNVMETYCLYPTKPDGLFNFLFNLMTVMLFISVLHLFHKLIHIKPWDDFITKTSINLNSIYLIHWIILGWCIILFQVSDLSYGVSALAGFALAWICILIANKLPTFNFSR